MAVSEQTPYIEYTANGTATSFALEFDCDNRDHLIVLVDDIEPVVGTWSLSSGAVVFNTAPENGKKITIQRNTPFSRTTDYQSYNNSFRPPAVNNDFDRVWYKIQELGVKDWLLDLKIQKFRDDVNLTALENTLEEARRIRDDTADSVVEVQSNVAQSQTLLENTTAQANLAQGYASSANSANAAAQQAVIDVSTAEADVYSALSAQQIAVNNSLTAIAGGHKAYQTLAAAQTAQASLPANTVVEVTNDPTASNNGTYQWNGTTLTKSAYDPLTQAKDYFKNNADVRFEANDTSNINYTTVDRNLTFSNNIYVITNAVTKLLTTPQVLNLPDNTRYRIEYNISTDTLRAVAYNASRTDDWALAGIVSVSSEGLVTSDFACTVNGAVLVKSPQDGELLTNVSSRIAFDTIASVLTIAATVRVKSPLYTTPASLTGEAKTVAIPTNIGIYRLQYDIKTSVFSFVSASLVQADSTIALATLYVESTGIKVVGITNYQIDGIVANGPALGIKTGQLIAVANSEINFDFKNKQLIIAASRVRLISKDTLPALLPAVTLDISGDESFIKRLMYNTKTSTFRAIRANVTSTEDEIQVALFCVNTKFVDGVPYYQIDGEDPVGKKDDLAIAKFTVPYGDLTANYEQADLPAFAQLQTSTPGDHIKVYDLYDALMASHPEYITKTLLGTDGIGNNIYQYQFTTPEVPTVAEVYSKKPKIVAISGVHGYEPTAIYNLFYALKQIVEHWKDDPHLEALYWGVNFIVVPVAVPSGFDLISRHNHNDVDIARNFPANWSAAQPNSGGSPLSQAETVILDAVMSNNKDAIYCFSHHNFHTPAGNFIWNASGSDFGINLAKMLIIGQTIRAKNRYPLMMPQANNYYIGYANKGTPPGSEGLQAQSYGMQSGTFEICNRWEWEVGQPSNSSVVATMGVETLINWLLLNVKHACEFYNSRVNI